MLRHLPVIALILLGFGSCGKDSNNEITSSFSWTYEGITYTAKTDTAYTISVYAQNPPLILATQNGRFYAPSPELIIHLASFNGGTYPFTVSGPNELYYIDPLGFDRYAIGGSLNITSNNGNRLAGNFSTTLDNGKPFTGSFTNLPVR